MMMHRGHGDAGCVEMEIGGQQFVHGGEDGDCIFGRGIGGAGRIRLDGGHKSDAQAGRLQLAVDAEVVPAKGAGSGYGYTQNGLISYCAAPFSGSLPCTTFRQRL